MVPPERNHPSHTPGLTSSTRITDLIPHYSRWLRGDDRRPRGRDKYVRTIQSVANWIGEDADLSDLDERAVRRYREDMADRALSASTIGNHLSVIRDFCKWAMGEGLRDDDPTWRQQWPSKAEAEPRALTQDELDALLKAIASPQGQDEETVWYWRRNRRAIMTMLYTGLRLSEMSDLVWKDIQFQERRLVVRNGKGGKSRSIPIHSALLAIYLEVPAVDRIGGKAICGKREDGLPLTYKSFANIFKVWLPRYGITITAHQLRHTFASQLLYHNANLHEIQVLLGHKRLDTTQIYLRLDERRKREAVERLPAYVAE
nr:tyrosine-type recombinase/integrase [Oscillochloris sp. ZM17-4]